MEQRGGLLEPAGGPQRQSAALFNLHRLKGLRDRGIFTDPRGQRICGRGRNSSSWADSSAVHNRPVEAFEVETRGSPVLLKVARLRGATRSLACTLAGVHTRAAVILMGSPTEKWGEDRNMMFAQTVR